MPASVETHRLNQSGHAERFAQLALPCYGNSWTRDEPQLGRADTSRITRWIGLHQATAYVPACRFGTGLTPQVVGRQHLFGKPNVVHAGFSDAFVASYVKLKLAEWQSYAGVITDWERERTLDWTRRGTPSAGTRAGGRAGVRVQQVQRQAPDPAEPRAGWPKISRNGSTDSGSASARRRSLAAA